MKVREMIKTDMDELVSDLIGKISIDKNILSLTINEILDKAIEEKIFIPEKYIFTEDEETLRDMLAFSLGLSSLWNNYKKENPEADIQKVNLVIIEFMRHMWGLDKIPTLNAGEIINEL